MIQNLEQYESFLQLKIKETSSALQVSNVQKFIPSMQNNFLRSIADCGPVLQPSLMRMDTAAVPPRSDRPQGFTQVTPSFGSRTRGLSLLLRARINLNPLYETNPPSWLIWIILPPFRIQMSLLPSVTCKEHSSNVTIDFYR